MFLRFLRWLNENFRWKVFAIFILFIVVVSISFTSYWIYQQNKSLQKSLRETGETISRILAYNLRIGIFSENEELLRDPIAGVFQQEEVLEVSVFNAERKLLEREGRAGIEPQGNFVLEEQKIKQVMMTNVTASRSTLYLERKDTLQFWSPVFSSAAYALSDPFLSQKGSSKEARIIGFIKIVLDKTRLRQQVNTMLIKSISIGVLFLILGAVFIFVVARRITTPLERLTEGVKSLEKGSEVQQVAVEAGDEFGRLAHAFNSMVDSLKKREAEKQTLEEQLRHAQKMEAIGTLAGGIAHDFNNILTAIMGFGGLIQMQIPKASPIMAHVEQILASAQKAASLTQNLLAFSRKQLSTPKPLNLNENISNLKKLLGRLIKEDIEFKLELDKKDLIVMADQGQIDQILMNLVTNAKDAMPTGGVLTITTKAVKLAPNILGMSQPRSSGDYALISVTDTGIGMDEKTKERIFDPFFTTKAVGKGTGLGLSMIYGIVKQHEGYIEVESEVGEGATFNIYLPLIDSALEKKKEKALRPVEKGTETILIAEDDPSVAGLVKRVLEEFGYKVLEAIDGENAIEQFLKNKDTIQLLLLDVIMPKKNGKEAYDAIRKIKPEIKALFISGYPAEIIDEQEIIAGLHFIGKPVSPEELLFKVREVLDHESPSINRC